MASALFFRHGHLLVLSILVILVAGVSAITTLPRLEDPRIDLRNVLVLTSFPGASAQRVEALVTDVLEDELRTLFEIKKIESTSSAGFSSIGVELQDWVDDSTNQQIFSKIRDAIADASTRFPDGVSDPVLDDKRGATAFTQIVSIKPHAQHPVSLTVVSRLADEMADRLRNISGTELVRIFGAPQEEVVVEIDPNQLAMAGLTVQEVSHIIRQADPKLPSGSLVGNDYNIRIQVAESVDSLDAIRSIPLLNNQGTTLRLGDIASVKKAWQTPESSIMLVDSQRVVTVAARMQTNFRVDKWTQQANTAITQFRSEFGDSVDVEVVFEQNQYTHARLEELTTNLMLGSLVVMCVIFLFMGWKASFIVGLALPLCASFTLFSLSFFGEQIHQMSIFGIIIAIGLLIDNAIVITDEIRINLMEPGVSRLEAMRKAVKHLFVPLSASTITTVLGFMPIFLLNGNIGDFIGPIAISVVMALVGSLVISLTIIAALAARYLPLEVRSLDSQPLTGTRKMKMKAMFTGIDLPEVSSSFEQCVLWAVRHPKRIVVFVVAFCISGFLLASQLANVFFPSADRNQFQVYVWSNFGQSIYETHDAIKSIDTRLKSIAHVEQVTWHIGGSTPSVYYNQVMGIENRSNYANAVVTTDSVESAANLTATLQRSIQDTHPELRVVVRGFGQGPPIYAPVEIEIFGPDLAVLNELGQQVRLAMSQIPGITQSIASVTFTEPEFVLETDQDVAATVSVGLNAISAQLSSALRGQTNGSLLQGTEDIPIRVRIPDEARSAPSSIGGLPILSSQRISQWASVDTIGELALKPAISGISRLNGERLNKVQAFLLPGVPAVDVSNQLRDYLAENVVLPAGYRLSMSGDADQQDQAIGQLAAYLPVLLVLMITTLILTFSSVRLAVVIGAVAALSVGLGFLSLWISGLPIGFNPILGSAGLIGVTINGSIVVIAAIKANKHARAGSDIAIVKETMGCSRHILSTTLTTVGGLIPLLIFAQGSFWPPLAVVIAGGVGFSVVLSLFFTPAVVALLTRNKQVL